MENFLPLKGAIDKHQTDRNVCPTTPKHDNAPQGLLLGRVGREPESSGFDYRRKRRVRTELL